MNLDLVNPSIHHKEAAIDYIKEHYEYNSKINGSGSLEKYLDNYEEWLEKLENDKYHVQPGRVPAETYFLVRKSDNRIIGMSNLRLELNERLQNCGGHIGYGIRPTERKKGYNKINLYLILKRYQNLGINKVYLDCDKKNVGSYKTMEALGGIRIKEYYAESKKCDVYRYEIDVNKSVKKYKSIFEREE